GTGSGAGPRRGGTPGLYRACQSPAWLVAPAPRTHSRLRREGDRLYARGAQDMKVSALVEAQVYRELAGGLPYPLALQLVTDEEVGGRDGTLHQIERGVSGEFVVIGQPHGPARVAHPPARTPPA